MRSKIPSWSSTFAFRPVPARRSFTSAARTPTRSGTSTDTRRRTRIAVRAGRASPALAITSMTFEPAASRTDAWNVPSPETVARSPRTVTTADAGRTVPRSSTVAARTTAESDGAVTSRRTGGGGGRRGRAGAGPGGGGGGGGPRGGGGGGGGPPAPPQPPASAHAVTAASGSRRLIAPRGSGRLRPEPLDAPAPRPAGRRDLDD